MFVIGGPSVHEAGLLLSSDRVFSTKKILQEPGHENDMIDNGDSVPIGIALLHYNGNLHELQPSVEKPSIKLMKRQRWISFIHKHLIDLVVYGRKTSADRCGIFEAICDEYCPKPHSPSPNYILRHFHPKVGAASLNRCTISTQGFQPSAYLLGEPSPSRPNQCTGPLRSISLLDKFQFDIQADLAPGITSDRDADHGECSSDQASSALVNSLDVDKLENVMQQEQESAMPLGAKVLVHYAGLQSTAKEKLELARANLRLIGQFNEPHPLYRENLNNDPDHISKIQSHQNQLIDHNLVSKPHVSYWFEYVFNVEHPNRSRVKCHYCEKYYRKYGFCPKWEPKLAKETGMLERTYAENNRIIDDHWKDPRHIKTVQNRLIEQVGTISDMYFTRQLQQDTGENAKYAATNRRFRSLLTLAQEGWSINSYEELIRLQRANGLPLGTHYLHFAGASKMLKFVYHENHERLIDFIMSDNKPISLIVDSATDNTRTHYLVALLQRMEHNAPVVYFYKMIPIGSKERATDLRDAIVNEFESEKPGFSNHMKLHLVGFASDGASVMTADRGLGKLMEEWCGKPLFRFHCAAHRLELVFKRALHDDPYSMEFEKFLNKLYSFSNSRSHKNKHFLKEIAEEMDEPLLNLAYIYEVRWASSHFSVLEKIWKSYKALCFGLKAMSVNNDFSKKSRAEAKELLEVLTDRRFILQLAFRLDVLNQLKHQSLMLQKRGALIFDKPDGFSNLIKAFQKMRTEDGYYLSKLKEELKCSYSLDHMLGRFRHLPPEDVILTTEDLEDENEEYQFPNGCSETQLYAGHKAVWRDVVLAPMCLEPDFYEYHRSVWGDIGLPPVCDDNSHPKLEDVRGDILDDLEAEVVTYFPQSELEHFKIFDPLNFPNFETEIDSYGENEIIQVAQLLGYNANEQSEVQNEWRELVRHIFNDPEFFVNRESDPNYFWFFYLNDNLVEFKPQIREVLECVMTFAVTSSDAERAFSQMGLLKTQQRNRMGHELLNALMWFKMNVASSVEEFAALDYSKKWEAAGHLLVDDEGHPAKRQRLDEFDYDDEYNVRRNEKVLSGKSSLF